MSLQFSALGSELKKNPRAETQSFDAFAKAAHYGTQFGQYAAKASKTALSPMAKSCIAGADKFATVARPIAKGTELFYDGQDLYKALTEEDTAWKDRIQNAAPSAIFVVFKAAYVLGHVAMLACWLKPNKAVNALSAKFLSVARNTLPAVWVAQIMTANEKGDYVKAILEGISDAMIFFPGSVTFVAKNWPINNSIGYGVGTVCALWTMKNAWPKLKADYNVFVDDTKPKEA